MAAGLGFKTFTTGDVLSAADVNGYLMQGVLVFASTAARDAAITSPQEGQFAFTKDTDQLWYRSASAWVASGATGDIEGVTAGTGITGGGTSGTVTITNDMATTITAAGDIVVGTGSGTYDNLPIGTTNQILTADTTVSPYKVKWATLAGGSMTLLSTTTLSGASTTISGISGSYKNLYIEVDGFYPDSSTSIRVRINGLTTGVYRDATKASQGSNLATSTLGSFALDVDSVAGTENFGYIYINNYASATNWKILDIYSVAKNNNGATYVTHYPAYLYVRETNAVSSITLFPVSGNWSAGSVRVYGVN